MWKSYHYFVSQIPRIDDELSKAHDEHSVMLTSLFQERMLVPIVYLFQFLRSDEVPIYQDPRMFILFSET